MLRCPRWFTPLDQPRIQRAIAHAEGRRTVPTSLISLCYVSETAAIDAAFDIFEAVVETLNHHHSHQPAATLRATAEDLLDQIVVLVGGSSPYHDRLDTLASVLRRERETRPWWPPFQATLDLISTTAKTSRKHTARDVERLKAERERVVLPLLEELDWTPTKWATKSGVNASVTIDYLEGKSTPRKVHMTRIRNTLATALNQLHTLRLPQ